MNKILMIFVSIFCLFSCAPKEDLFEETYKFQKFEWSKSVEPEIVLNIMDTAKLYDLYFVMRHLNTYQYNNIRVAIIDSARKDSAVQMLYNFKLGKLQKWLGTTMNDVVEYRVKINNQPLQIDSSENKFVLKQMMAEDVVKGILQAGLRMQPAK